MLGSCLSRGWEEREVQGVLKPHVVPAVLQNERNPLAWREEREVVACCVANNVAYVSHPPADTDPNLVAILSHPYMRRIGTQFNACPEQV